MQQEASPNKVKGHLEDDVKEYKPIYDKSHARSASTDEILKINPSIYDSFMNENYFRTPGMSWKPEIGYDKEKKQYFLTEFLKDKDDWKKNPTSKHTLFPSIRAVEKYMHKFLKEKHPEEWED